MTDDRKGGQTVLLLGQISGDPGRGFAVVGKPSHLATEWTHETRMFSILFQYTLLYTNDFT